MTNVKGRSDGHEPQEKDRTVPDHLQGGVTSIGLLTWFTSTELKLDISLVEWAFVSFVPTLVFMVMFVVRWCGLGLRHRGRESWMDT